MVNLFISTPKFHIFRNFKCSYWSNLSNLLVNSWWEPKIILKHGLKSKTNEYTRFYLIELFCGIAIISTAQYMTLFLNMMTNIVESTIVIVVIMIIALIIFKFFVHLYRYPKLN